MDKAKLLAWWKKLSNLGASTIVALFCFAISMVFPDCGFPGGPVTVCSWFTFKAAVGAMFVGFAAFPISLLIAFGTPPLLVISEPDLEAALEHLRSLDYRNSLPKAWDRQHLLGLIRAAAGARPKVGQLLDIAPGVFGIIKPFGVDLAGCREPDGRLQVWLTVRQAGTDAVRVTEL